MNKKNARSLLMVVVLALGFTGGVLFISTLGASSNHMHSPAEQGARTTQTTRVTPEGKALLKQFSAAFEDAAARVNPSVVPIFSTSVEKVQNPFAGQNSPFGDFFGKDFFRHFFNAPQEQTIHSLGSGVIVSDDGYILTNNHVVKGAEKVTVVLPGKEKYTAKVIGTDPLTDIAVIKIDARNLTKATLGDSDSLRVGEWVIAVGNPFELMHTVTAGIVSAVGRSSVNLADYEDFIQTDASINPGNSGGALADLDGNVIGINTAIYSPSGDGGNVGIGFAIPINMAKSVMHQLISKGKVTRGYVGLLLQDIDQSLAKAMNLKSTNGALVADVTAGGPAAKAGVKRGDVITKFDGKEVENTVQLRNMVAAAEPGTRATFDIIRDHKDMELTVVLGERPKNLGQSNSESGTEQNTSKKLGLSIQTLTPTLAKQLGYQDDHGVVVTAVAPGSVAEEAGLQQGDLIKEVDQKRISSVEDFDRATEKLKSGDSVAFLVRRGQNTFFAAVTIP